MRKRLMGWMVASAVLLAAGCAGRLPPLERNAPPMRVVICSPELSTKSADRAAVLARQEKADAVLLTSPNVNAAGVLWQWVLAQRDAEGNVTFAPPLTPSPAPVASFDAGRAHFCFLDNDAVIAEGSPAAEALINDLSQSRKAWKFLFLDRPIASSRIGADLDYVGRLIERENVLLVVAPSASGYLRSRPIGVAPESAVRYIALPSDPTKADAPRPWLARIVAGGDYVLLDLTAERMLWRLFDRDGKALDIVEIPAHNRAGTASGMMTYGELFTVVNTLETGSER